MHNFNKLWRSDDRDFQPKAITSTYSSRAGKAEGDIRGYVGVTFYDIWLYFLHFQHFSTFSTFSTFFNIFNLLQHYKVRKSESQKIMYGRSCSRATSGIGKGWMNISVGNDSMSSEHCFAVLKIFVIMIIMTWQCVMDGSFQCSGSGTIPAQIRFSGHQKYPSTESTSRSRLSGPGYPRVQLSGFEWGDQLATGHKLPILHLCTFKYASLCTELGNVTQRDFLIVSVCWAKVPLATSIAL